MTALKMDVWPTEQLRRVFHANCLRLTAPVVAVWLWHSCGAPSFKLSTAALGGGVRSTAQLRCDFTRIVNGLLNPTCVYRLYRRYGAPSRYVSTATAYGTCYWCLSYGTAAVRLRARWRRLH